MQKKITGWKTKGMNRDLSVSAYNPEFAFENMNLRLSTNEGNTMLSWVNERGPKKLDILINETPWVNDILPESVDGGGSSYKLSTIKGCPIGTAVINHKLVLFTTTNVSTDSSDFSNIKAVYEISADRILDMVPEPSLDITPQDLTGEGLPDDSIGNNYDTYTDALTGYKYLKKNGHWILDKTSASQPAITDDPEEENTGSEGSEGDNEGNNGNNNEDDPGTTVPDMPYNPPSTTNIRIVFDRIYVLWFGKDSEGNEVLLGKLIYGGKLDFITSLPLETLPSYEASHIQKIYWTDGRNQPRVINIAADSTKLGLWNTAVNNGIDTFFDFIPTVQLDNTAITIDKQSGDGTFAAGVIQYIFTYINKYGQQTNPFYVSPLYYLSHNDRGASPEDKVTCQFTITISNADTNFDYIRVYSLQRTSLDLEPFVKYLEDLKIRSDVSTSPIIYTDNGTTGSTVDPTEMLYLGGKEISALTMTEKDQKLFLGNIIQKNTSVAPIQDYFDGLRTDSDTENNIAIGFTCDSPSAENQFKVLELKPASGIYTYTNELDKNRREITTFKYGDRYRFGFQLQKTTGEWLEPIFIDDVTNDKHPVTSVGSTQAYLPYAEAAIDVDAMKDAIYQATQGTTRAIDWTVIKRIRPVVVYPTIADRNVLCQGVLNPTVFNALDRIDNSPYAQASWYFRPYTTDEDGIIDDAVITGDSIDVETDSNITSDYDSNFSSVFNDGPLDHRKAVYVLVTRVDNNKLNNILTNGYLTYKISSVDVIKLRSRVYFDGVIAISSHDDDTSTIAFFKTTVWGPIDVSNDKYYTELKEEATNLKVWINNNSNTGFYIYSDIQTDELHFYYYDKYINAETSNLDTYVFEFNYNNGSDTFKTVTFTTVANTNNSLLGLNGSKTVFKHYNRLLTSSDIFKTSHIFKIPAFYNLKKVEVQGSAKIYDTVYSVERETDEDGEELNTNNQFFIDQSIVTLNSPDIDFDTEVQSYGTDNLKLRIVGAIPITANTSWHSIHASSMLSDFYNINTKEIKDEDLKKALAEITKKFGQGELNKNVYWENINLNAGRRLIADALWNDVNVYVDTEDNQYELLDSETNIFTSGISNKVIYPWHKKGSLCNDPRTEDKAASILKRKVESNILYSATTCYCKNDYDEFGNIGVQVHLTENSSGTNIRLSKQNEQNTYCYDINYYPNIDKVLYNNKGWYEQKVKTVKVSGNAFRHHIKEEVEQGDPIATVVPMKYKSTSHAVISLHTKKTTDIGGNENKDCIPILPYGTYTDNSNQTVYPGKYSYPASPMTGYKTFWNENVDTYIAQDSISIKETVDEVDHDLFNGNLYQYLWLGELYKPEDQNKVYFGGTTKEAIKANKWVVGGDAQDFTDGTITLRWTEGDTYFQRYDCLKTYAYTPEDINQIVEILSFMCETHVNLDGRYDKNRGQIDNTNMSPQNFNLLNPVYTQKDNFFTYKKSDIDNSANLQYPNYIYYSKTKQSGADVDLYTNVTLGSTLELDGDKGDITSLQRLNDQIIAFQDSGISQILYNENTAISTTQGVPIELANSGKVQGARYITDTVGCSNKWSVKSTPMGIYFIDSNNKDIYKFNGQLNNLSAGLGFSSWAKNNIPTSYVRWTPNLYDNFVTYYDKQNQDVLFINKKNALAYSEKFNTFTSFYDYGKIPYFANLDDVGLWIRFLNGESTDDLQEAADSGGTYIYQHQAGEYSNFFGVNKPFSMTLIGNPEPQMDKIFTNLEFRASVGDDGEYVDNTGKFTPTLPFDSLETWNEYQHGITNLKNLTGIDAVRHHIGNDSSLKRKFRMWRCDIPRDNADVDSSTEAAMGITRFKKRLNDRMRNPWLYLKLTKNLSYYTDEEVTEHNSKIDGAVTVNTPVPELDPVEYYTKGQANILNTSIEGAWQYDTQPKPIKKTEIHDLLMTYFS